VSESLVNIDRWRCSNRGGVKRVKLVLPEDVSTYSSSTAEAGIEVSPGKEIYHIEVDPRTGFHEEQLQGNDQGDRHNKRVGFDIRRLRQDVVTLRTRLMNRRVHVIFTDENDETYLYLNMRLRQANATNRYAQKNKTDFVFAGASIFPAPYVVGELLPEPDPGDAGTPQVDNGGLDGDIPSPDTTGGTAGGGTGDDLGDGNPDTGDGGGDDPDPPDFDPNDVTFLQPSTGDYFRITIGECDEVITTKVVP